MTMYTCYDVDNHRVTSLPELDRDRCRNDPRRLQHGRRGVHQTFLNMHMHIIGTLECITYIY